MFLSVTLHCNIAQHETVSLSPHISLQAQMVRRVKAYLKAMKVITDEEELHRMSQEVEPPSGGQPAPAIPVITTVGLGHAVTRSRGHAVLRRCGSGTRARARAR